MRNGGHVIGYTPTFNLLPSPVWKVVGFLSYDVTDNFRFDLSQRWRSSLAWTGNPNEHAIGGIDDVAYTNVTFTYNLNTDAGNRYSVFLNVQNVFNTDPPPSGTPGLFNQPGFPTNGFAVGDDVLGRYYTLGLRARF